MARLTVEESRQLKKTTRIVDFINVSGSMYLELLFKVGVNQSEFRTGLVLRLYISAEVLKAKFIMVPAVFGDVQENQNPG